MVRRNSYNAPSKAVRVAANTEEQTKHLSRLLDDGFVVVATATQVKDGVTYQVQVNYSIEKGVDEELKVVKSDLQAATRCACGMNWQVEAHSSDLSALISTGSLEDLAALVPEVSDPTQALAFLADVEPESSQNAELACAQAGIEVKSGIEPDEVLTTDLPQTDLPQTDDFAASFLEASKEVEIAPEYITIDVALSNHVETQAALEQHKAEMEVFAQQLFQVWERLSGGIWGEAVSIDRIYDDSFHLLMALSFLAKLAELESQPLSLEGVKLHLCDRPIEGESHFLGGRLCNGIAFGKVVRSQPKLRAAIPSMQPSGSAPISHPAVMPLGALMQQLEPGEPEFLDRLRQQSLRTQSSSTQTEPLQPEQSRGQPKDEKINLKDRLRSWLS